MKNYFIAEHNLNAFVTDFSKDHNVFVPHLKGDKYQVAVFSEDTIFSFNPYRISTPLVKSLLFGAVEKVVPLPAVPRKKNVVFGVKACDMAAVAIMDYVFKEGDFQDPIYIGNREKTIFISSDCTDCLETCFCTLVGYNPYPEKGFDINISPVTDGYVLTVATKEGQGILEEMVLQEPTEDQLQELEVNRNRIADKVQAQVAYQDYNVIASPQQAVMNNFESPVWKEKAENCVECGACNLVCPTCHCFLLSDHDKERYRQWDACQYRGFALVAGGANPRKGLYERLRNRYVKKFDYFQKNIKLNGCLGCGRCISACIGRIDIREVLKELVTRNQ